ncbi:MAG: metallopeptidase family protein [Alphaproteobacteria bacterium]|nr:MAG: metallopeptidase family protein [Alphaproteobacteria bacterium]
MAEDAYATIPAGLRAAIDQVVFRVEEWPDARALASVGLRFPEQLLGLYQGVSIDRRSIHDSGRLPDVIRLYRQPILRHARATGTPVEAVVRHVLIHEIGHHFGLSDADMAAIEAADGEDG